MTSPLSMSTDHVAARERAPQWREWIWQHFGGLESDFYGDTAFDGHMAAARAGDVVMTQLEANRHRVLRTAGMVRTSDQACLKIVAPWQGSAAVTQYGRSVSVRNGAWTIYDTTEGYTVDNPEPSDHLIVMLPRERIRVDGHRLRELMARPAGGASGISRVALDTMRSTYRELPFMSESAARVAGELIVQLVQLSLLEVAGLETANSQRAALRDRIRAHVALRLRDPDLSIDGIAQALNCSKRLLHAAFADEEDTLAGYILRERIDACARALRDPARATQSLTDIAVDCGFGNLSHFSRVFRARTGLSPSAYRHAAGENAR